MNNKAIYIFYLLLSVLLSSCSSVYYLQVQTGTPGKEDLSPEIQSLTLINRTVDSNYYNYAEDTLQQLFYRKQFKLDTVLYDLESVDTTLKALGDLLFESGRYDIVIPENRFLYSKKNGFITKPMEWDEVDELCKTFNTNAVLALDFFRTSVATKYDSETLYDDAEDRYFRAYMATMAIQYEALFRVYDPVSKKISNSVIKDTLWWDDADLSNKTLFSRFTSVKDALIESGIAVALDYSDKISPQWKNDWRKYFDKGVQQFEVAHEYAKKSDWENALQLWLTVSEQARGKSLRSKAEYNVALAYEMLGDVNKAIEWGVKSYKTFYRPLTVEYLNILKKRKAEIDKSLLK
ncbi:MAG: hypothetical protein JW833_07330 [Prolixibacteraceae bacterium]|nr:hypothetical protein [Prolixibacteraceae bacterium]